MDDKNNGTVDHLTRVNNMIFHCCDTMIMFRLRSIEFRFDENIDVLFVLVVVWTRCTVELDSSIDGLERIELYMPKSGKKIGNIIKMSLKKKK